MAYGCDFKCLVAQLDAYFKGAYSCPDWNKAKVVTHTGRPYGGPPSAYGNKTP